MTSSRFTEQVSGARRASRYWCFSFRHPAVQKTKYILRCQPCCLQQQRGLSTKNIPLPRGGAQVLEVSQLSLVFHRTHGGIKCSSFPRKSEVLFVFLYDDNDDGSFTKPNPLGSAAVLRSFKALRHSSLTRKLEKFIRKHKKINTCCSCFQVRKHIRPNVGGVFVASRGVLRKDEADANQ